MTGHTFISYAHEDSRFVNKLARHLRERGMSVWLDQWHIDSGAEWGKVIERAILGCDFVLIVLSPAAVESWVVRQQYLWAIQNNKKMLIILYQPCETPPDLIEVPQIDFVKQRYNVALVCLLRHIFPMREVTPDFLTKLQEMIVNDIDWRWWYKLRPLLWPGWLGPTLVLATALIVLILTLVKDERVRADAAIETLAVVKVTITPTPHIETWVRPIDKKMMVYIPPGTFLMGSSEAELLADEDEWPQHSVFVDDYWIDMTEITNSEYALCVEAGACTPQRHQGQRFSEDDQPVVGVDWYQSAAYCEWVNGRLPTEAEWEKAARGTDGRVYPWGNQFDGARLNYCDANCIQDWKDPSVNDGYKYTAPVGSYPDGASPYGVLDMSGNVWEWTADWYEPDYYAKSDFENPAGPATGQQRVIRGGSWHYTGRNLRVGNRHKEIPTFSYDKTGFRCVVNEAF